MAQKNHWYIVINPAAGNGKVGLRWPAIQARLDALRWSYIAQQTKSKGAATTLVKEGIEMGYTQILAVGGDGTNNEAINGIFLQKAVPTTAITYALLPIGTGNDWIKTHQTPTRLDLWLAMMEKGTTSFQDIGKVKYHWKGAAHERYFINVAGMGYDAYVSRVAESQKGRVSNQLFYFYLAFQMLGRVFLKKGQSDL